MRHCEKNIWQVWVSGGEGRGDGSEAIGEDRTPCEFCITDKWHKMVEA